MELRPWVFALLALLALPALLASCGVPAGDDDPPAHLQAPSCLTGQLACPSGCVDVATDPLQCGACGAPCAPGMACEAGACRDVWLM